jgi:transposase
MFTEASTALFAGLDLHARNVYCAVKDSSGAPLMRKRLPNDLPQIVQTLEPFRAQLKAVAVESTFNWYWLVDGLQAAGFPVRLANPAKMDAYSGLKRTDDESDALWLAEMLRLGILPEGYIYPKEARPVRDMLRRRLLVARQATQTVLSLQAMVTRHTGATVSGAKVEKWTLKEVKETFADPYSQQTAEAMLELLGEQRRIQHHLEKQVLEKVKLCGRWEKLLSLPGVGNILGITIMLETGPIERFASAGQYASYCRTVDSRCDSDGKPSEARRSVPRERDDPKGEPSQTSECKRRARTTARTATNIWRGRMWKRRILRNATTNGRSDGLNAKRRARIASWRSKRWRASCPRRRITCCATARSSARQSCLDERRFRGDRQPAKGLVRILQD